MLSARNANLIECLLAFEGKPQTYSSQAAHSLKANVTSGVAGFLEASDWIPCLPSPADHHVTRFNDLLLQAYHSLDAPVSEHLPLWIVRSQIAHSRSLWTQVEVQGELTVVALQKAISR